MITIKDVLRQLIRDLRAEKLRTFLTIFGIVWGTVAISLMLAFGTGLHQHLIVQTAGLGDRIVIAWPSATSIPFQGLGKGRRIRATDDDIAFIQAQVKGLKGICGEYQNSLRVDYNTKNLSVDTVGINAAYGRMRNQIPAPGGRFINDLDVNDQRRVAFIGNKLSNDLFGEGEAVGKTILVNHSPFLIIGVLQKKQQDGRFVEISAKRYHDRRSLMSCVTFWPSRPDMWHVAQVGTGMSRAVSFFAGASRCIEARCALNSTPCLDSW